MEANRRADGIVPGRLEAEDYASNFADLHPPLDPHEAAVEADRCYFCYDAPCIQACPTSIDIPLFIRQIATGNPSGSAKTILESNIMGGMCARVCPTETLCEEVCVRNDAEEKPVRIGELQRYATDHLLTTGGQPFSRGAATGKSVAVVGGGPAGLACAHELARHGHDVVLHEAREKLGGLNEYGIAAYKTVDGFAQREVDFILSIGGIEVKTGSRLGKTVTLDELASDHDAVFLAMGMGGTGALGLEGEDAPGIADAVDYISELRQADDLSSLPVGRRVVVIGGGMTAVDIAVQSKKLGAEEVTMVYRRGADRMNASPFEQDLAQTNGVGIRHWAAPTGFETEGGKVSGVTFEYLEPNEDGRLAGTGQTYTLQADQVFKAIGQSFVAEHVAEHGVELERGRIKVTEDRKTSRHGVWAGGDCVSGGEDLTVASVADGKAAALSIHRFLTGA